MTARPDANRDRCFRRERVFQTRLPPQPNSRRLAMVSKIRTLCPHCGKRLMASPSRAGSLGDCANCGGRVYIPTFDPDPSIGDLTDGLPDESNAARSSSMRVSSEESRQVREMVGRSARSRIHVTIEGPPRPVRRRSQTVQSRSMPPTRYRRSLSAGARDQVRQSRPATPAP